MGAFGHYVQRQIEEIRADTALRLYGACLGLGQLLTFRNWTERAQVTHLSDPAQVICWPFFEDCFRHRLFDHVPLVPTLWVYGAMAAVATLLFLVPRRCGLAYGWLVLTNIVKTMIYAQDFWLRQNQHYMLYIATIAFLFLPNKRHLLRYTLVAFYVWASFLKYDAEWLSGKALYHDPWLVPKALIPASCAYVVVLESFIVWGVLSCRRWLFWSSFAQLILFHIVSWPVVKAFYPMLMFCLLAVFPLARLFPRPEDPPSLLQSLLQGRQPRSTYAFLAFWTLMQLVPVAMPGDEKITGEGRLFSLHMFDARVYCQGAITLKFKDGTVKTLPIPIEGTTRIKCDPAVHFSRATRACDAYRGDPNFLDLDLSYQARRSNEPAMRPLVDVKDFCSRHLSYDLWRPNAWILKGDGRKRR